MHMQLNVLYGH